MRDTSALIPFHTFLWKVSSLCNLSCKYCYVYKSVDEGWRRQPKLMSPDVARQTALRMLEHLRAHDKKSVSIVFHGGEPLLGGLRHIRELISIIKDVFRGSGVTVSLGMQTNLLLLDEDMAEFFLQNNICLGVSLDGPPEVNDINRIDLRGRPSSARLEKKLSLLLSPRYKKIFGGFLCVINPHTDPVAITEYLLSYDPIGIDFLLPLDNHQRLPAAKNGDVNSAVYGDWLVKSFDYWMSRPNSTRVRIFQSIINMICGANSLVEALGLHPVDLIVIETNGEIEAVDSLKTTYSGATRLGFNVVENDFNTVAGHIGVKSRQMGAMSLCQQCKDCHLVGVCGGGYLPHRYSETRGFDNPSVYCFDLQRIIVHIYRSLRSSVGQIQAGAVLEEAAV